MNNTPGDLRPQERTDAPEHKPSGELGGHPINADETAPREHVPDAGSGPSGAPPGQGRAATATRTPWTTSPAPTSSAFAIARQAG